MADEPTTADPWVEMTHPTLPDSPPAPALRTTFDLVWEPLGWRLHTPGDEPVAPAADTVTAPEPESVSDTPAAARRKTAAPAAPKED
ncbi:hypothetical protein ABZ439_11595 [Streptomyces sp. NPDC005840]|uniref:hypothetical protein n=1 Tax=Streptomyces sp. NPDC005840 TaxID=3157072 RepID=UPI00340DCE57